MTQEDLNQLANKFVVEDGLAYHRQESHANTYKEGFKKALELVLDNIDLGYTKELNIEELMTYL